MFKFRWQCSLWSASESYCILSPNLWIMRPDKLLFHKMAEDSTLQGYSILTLLKFDYKIRVLYRVNSMYWCSSVACHTINFTYLGWISPLDDQCSSFCSGSEGEFIFYGLKTKICFVILVLTVKQPKILFKKQQPKILFSNSCTGRKTTKDSVGNSCTSRKTAKYSGW